MGLYSFLCSCLYLGHGGGLFSIDTCLQKLDFSFLSYLKKKNLKNHP